MKDIFNKKVEKVVISNSLVASHPVLSQSHMGGQQT